MPALPNVRRAASLAFIFLLVEFFDELHYGLSGAALPVIRQDLGLTYAQVGMLLGLPKISATLIEPAIMLLGDSTWRKHLVIGGGLAVVLAVLLTASSTAFLPLLIAFFIGFPASGAFVTLSQATLMDLNPGREAQTMARWTVFGSAGNLLGPAILSGLFALGLSWRWPFLGLALLAGSLGWLIWRRPFPAHQANLEAHAPSLGQTPTWMWDNLRQALRTPGLARWVTLLELSDLMLDVLTSYIALYLADIVGLSPAQTGLALTLLMAASFTADLVVIPLLERLPGRKLVRTTAMLVIPLFIAFLLVPSAWAKIILLIGVRLSTMGWYSVLQGEAYAAVPGRSGTVMAITSTAGLLGGALVWLIGLAANHFGLATALWLLLAGPIALALFVPQAKSVYNNSTG